MKCVLKKDIVRKYLPIILLFVFAAALAGCGDGKYTYNIYFANENMTEIMSSQYKTDTEDGILVAKELVAQLERPQKSDKYKDISFGEMKGGNITDGKITVNFSEKKQMGEGEALMCRAALVKTLTQIEGVTSVAIQFDGNPAEYSDGTLIGALTLNDFIDDDLEPVESVEWKEVNLYFAGTYGDKLKKTTTYVAYNKNTTIEKMIIDKLIKGPADNSAGQTISNNVKLLNISVSNEVCYVNFNSAFLSDMVNVSADVTIYSIVNSLCGIDGISGVKILVNGDSSKKYREVIDLENTFEYNNAIVQTGSDY